MATDPAAHIAALRQARAATKDATTKDIVDFLGDPAKVAALRSHVANASEDDETGTSIFSPFIITATVAAGC